MSENEGQVSPSQLLFGRSWEDPAADRVALRIQPGDTIFAITSGACNVLGFLLDDPGKVFAVDINECQSHLLELKMAAMRALEHGAFASFVGARDSNERDRVYQDLRGDLSTGAATYWDGNPELVRMGIIHAGRYERFVGLFRRVLNVVQGRRRMRGLFENEGVDDQIRYFEDVWDTRRFRALLSMFFNKRVLARRGLSADYFMFDDSNLSFGEAFYQRTRHVMTRLSTRSNYFLASYLLGPYYSEQAMPDYLSADHYDLIRSRLDRIEWATGDAKRWLEERPAASIQRFALSNICEMMDDEDTRRTFEAVAHAATDGATACFRNLMIPRTVPDHLQEVICRDEALSKRLLQEDRSFVYGRVDALTIRPHANRRSE